MTTPSRPPDLRRRRIVVTLAVIAVGLCWWVWPRVDQRFVGKWTFCLEVTNHPLCELTFHREGGLSTAASSQNLLLIPSTWSVDSNVLIWGSRLPGRLQFLSPTVVPLMRQLTGQSDWGNQERFQIKRHDQDAIYLRHQIHRASYVLRRIPE